VVVVVVVVVVVDVTATCGWKQGHGMLPGGEGHGPLEPFNTKFLLQHDRL